MKIREWNKRREGITMEKVGAKILERTNAVPWDN